MKKLLVLVLILGLASAANATILTWTDSGGSAIDGISVVVGSTVTAYVSADDASTYFPKWLGANYSVGNYAHIESITALAAAGSDNGIVESGGSYTGWWTVEAKDITSPFTIASGNQFAIVIKGMVDSGVNTYDIDSDSYGTNDVLEITVTPEPMTIALLGLGGLFLRRRK